MRLRHRYDEVPERTDDDHDLYDDRPADRRALDQEDVVDTRTNRWDVGSVLAAAAGVALIVIGAVALGRTGVDETWYQPIEQVLGMDHTPLLAAAEIGVGAVLVLAALAGARMLAALVALAVGAAGTVLAIEPEIADRELAIEQEWALVLAIGGFVLAALLIVARERRHDRRVTRRSLRTA